MFGLEEIEGYKLPQFALETTSTENGKVSQLIRNFLKGRIH